MEAHTNWGIVAFAGAFAILAIGVAISIAYFGGDTPMPLAAITGTDTRANAYQSTDWQEALAAIATSTTDASGNYSAPAELGVTAGLSRELFVKYLQLKQDGTLTDAEVQQGVAELLKSNIIPITPTTVYTAAQIKTSSATSLDTYAGTLGAALRTSVEIKEYELVVFSRAVGRRDFNGSPELAAAASIYRSVEKDLASMSVPTALTAEHLSLLQSVQLLAQTTQLLAAWGGDPIDALAYIDAFSKAERSVQIAISDLFTGISVAAKQS